MTTNKEPVRIRRPRKSKVSVRGQTVIPKEIRDTLGIKPEAELDWSIHGGVMVVVPIPEDPVAASVGILKRFGYTWEDYLRDREEDLEIERRHEERLMGQVEQAETPTPTPKEKTASRRRRAIAG